MNVMKATDIDLSAYIYFRSLESAVAATKVKGKSIGEQFLPIVITAPHGGKMAPPNVAERVLRPQSGDSKLSDLYSQELALDIDKHITECTGRFPFVVMANFHRKYIDANRSIDENPFNMESESVGKAIFNRYHSLVQMCVEEAQTVAQPGQKVLLLDIHGCKHNEDVMSLILGTRSGASYDRVRQRTEQIGFEWHLRNLFLTPGVFKVLPDIGHPDVPRYSGGYTIASSSNISVLDAMQIEFNQSIRHSPMSRIRCATLLAEAYVRSYHADHHVFRVKTQDPFHNIIFLDIDGVLCNSKSHSGCYNTNEVLHFMGDRELPPLEIRCLKILKEIVVKSDAKIVLSSTWRLDERLVNFLKYGISHVGIEENRIIGMTPELDSGRGFEIRTWLEENSGLWKGYAIIDDSNEVSIREALPEPYTNLIRTNLFTDECFTELDEEGLSEIHITEVLKALQKPIDTTLLFSRELV